MWPLLSYYIAVARGGGIALHPLTRLREGHDTNQTPVCQFLVPLVHDRLKKQYSCQTYMHRPNQWILDTLRKRYSSGVMYGTAVELSRTGLDLPATNEQLLGVCTIIPHFFLEQEIRFLGWDDGGGVIVIAVPAFFIGLVRPASNVSVRRR